MRISDSHRLLCAFVDLLPVVWPGTGLPKGRLRPRYPRIFDFSSGVQLFYILIRSVARLSPGEPDECQVSLFGGTSLARVCPANRVLSARLPRARRALDRRLTKVEFGGVSGSF